MVEHHSWTLKQLFQGHSVFVCDICQIVKDKLSKQDFWLADRIQLAEDAIWTKDQYGWWTCNTSEICLTAPVSN